MSIPASQVIKIIILISVILLLAGLFLFSYVILYNKRKKRHEDEKIIMQKEFQQQLLQSQIEVQEATFSILGKELHDNVGQLLSTSRMLIGLTERALENPPDTLLTANATIGQAINEIRSLSKSLDKEWLERFSFSDNLKTEVDRINSANKIKLIYEQGEQIILKPDEQIILFRIVQEAIQNALKYAHASVITISQEIKERKMEITITDDGSGFDFNDNTGMGLNNMKHRTRLLGGTISWGGREQGGTIISIQIPFKEAGYE